MAGVSRQHRALFATDPAARCPRDEDDEDDGCEEDYEEDADGEGEADGNGEDGETEDDEEEEHAAKRFRVISGTDSDDDDEADENEEFGSPAQLQDVLGGSRRASPLTLGTTHLGEAGDDRVLSKIADDWYENLHALHWSVHEAMTPFRRFRILTPPSAWRPQAHCEPERGCRHGDSAPRVLPFGDASSAGLDSPRLNNSRATWLGSAERSHEATARPRVDG